MRKTGKKFLKLFLTMYIIAMVIRVSYLSADGHCPAIRADNFHAIKKMALRGHTIKEFGNKSKIKCAKLCAENDKCRSFNHDKTNGICQLKYARHVEFPDDLHRDGSFMYYVVDQNSEFMGQSLWPSGSYGLPMSVDGCPTADGFSWATGYRYHDTESQTPDNKWSAGLHLEGPYWANNMYQNFCMKTVDRVDYCEAEWPEGEYCLFKYGDHCPTNMMTGSIYWNDDDFGNTNTINGTLPSGQYDQDTRIDYCCMTSGSASQPIALPKGSPFYLFPYTAECQQVQGMTVTQEWFMWDCFDNHTAPVGSHPRYKPTGNDHYIHYCYYRQAI